jgi:hypothetical protein
MSVKLVGAAKTEAVIAKIARVALDATNASVGITSSGSASGSASASTSSS